VAVGFWMEPKIDSKEEEEAAARTQQMHVRSCWLQNLICYMKGACIEDFENWNCRRIGEYLDLVKRK